MGREIAKKRRMKFSACFPPDDPVENDNVVIHYHSSDNPATKAFVDQLDRALSITHNMFVAPATPMTIKPNFSVDPPNTETVQS